MIQASFEAAGRMGSEPSRSDLHENSKDIMFAFPPAKRQKLTTAEEESKSYRPQFPGLRRQVSEPCSKQDDASEESNNAAAAEHELGLQERVIPASVRLEKDGISHHGTTQVKDMEQIETTVQVKRRCPSPPPLTRRSTRSTVGVELVSLPYDTTSKKVETPKATIPIVPHVSGGNSTVVSNTRAPIRRQTRSSQGVEFAVLENHVISTKRQRSRSLSTTTCQLETPVSKTPLHVSITPQLPRILSLSGRGSVPQPSSPLSIPAAPSSAPSSPLSSPPAILFDPYAQYLDMSIPMSKHTLSHEGSSSEFSQDTSRGSSPCSTESVESDSFSQPINALGSASAMPRMQGKDLFDQNIWKDPLKTTVFYSFITTLRQKVRDADPTPSHRFISHLRDSGKLVRCYTQNIDQIEEKVGLSTCLDKGPGYRGRFSRQSSGSQQLQQILQGSQSRNDLSEQDRAKVERLLDRGVECVFLHGSLASLRCFQCSRLSNWDEKNRESLTLAGEQPACPHCEGAAAARAEKGKRALGVGKLRPDIVLYGEQHPFAEKISRVVTHDIALSPDLMLILGTSLKVDGLKRLVREFANSIHFRNGKVVFINLTKAAESTWKDVIDYWVEMDCDAWIADMKERKPAIWMPSEDASHKPAASIPKEKSEPKNPVALRPHKRNCIYYAVNIVDVLSAMHGRKRLMDDLPLAPKAKRLRRSGPSNLPQTMATINIVAPPLRQQEFPILDISVPASLAARPELVTETKKDVNLSRSKPAMPSQPESPLSDEQLGISILSAVKDHPRIRKRKMIDGEEVVLPRTSSRFSVNKVSKIPQKRASLPATLASKTINTTYPPQCFPDVTKNCPLLPPPSNVCRSSSPYIGPHKTRNSTFDARPLVPISANDRTISALHPHRQLLPMATTAFGYDDMLLRHDLAHHHLSTWCTKETAKPIRHSTGHLLIPERTAPSSSHVTASLPHLNQSESYKAHPTHTSPLFSSAKLTLTQKSTSCEDAETPKPSQHSCNRQEKRIITRKVKLSDIQNIKSDKPCTSTKRENARSVAAQDRQNVCSCTPIPVPFVPGMPISTGASVTHPTKHPVSDKIKESRRRHRKNSTSTFITSQPCDNINSTAPTSRGLFVPTFTNALSNLAQMLPFASNLVPRPEPQPLTPEETLKDTTDKFPFPALSVSNSILSHDTSLVENNVRKNKRASSDSIGPDEQLSREMEAAAVLQSMGLALDA